MKKTILIDLAAIFLSFFLSSVSAQSQICKIYSRQGSCIEELAANPYAVPPKNPDTVVISNDKMLFGSQVAVCPGLWKGAQGKAQIILCLDKSGSMVDTDPNKMLITVARAFVDSINRKSPESQIGIVLFGAGADFTKATGISPVPIGGNLAYVKSWIDQAANRTGVTPYGAALDTTIAMFLRTPVDTTSVSRVVVFLSDGAPNLGSNTDPMYTAWMQIQRYRLIPMIHTVYFYTPANYSAIARDTLLHLSRLGSKGAGIFTTVADPALLFLAFDSILAKINLKTDLKYIQLYNRSSGELQIGDTLNTSNNGACALLRYPISYLLEGNNPITIFYSKSVARDSSMLKDSTQIIQKSFVIKRLPSGSMPTTAQIVLFYKYFVDSCMARSTTQFANKTDWTPMLAGEQYAKYAGYNSAYVIITRGPSDYTVQSINMKIQSKSGDEEFFPLIEDGPVTNRYKSSIAFEKSSAKIPQNGKLELNGVDTLYAIYENEELYAGNEFLDKSYDTIVVCAENTGVLPLKNIDQLDFAVKPVQSQGIVFWVNLPKKATYSLSVFDVAGRMLWDYKKENADQGIQRVVWNNNGLISSSPPNGVYFIRLLAGEKKLQRQFLLVK